ncbi:hypothetical protein CGRA01v4_05965 [Colletotrichum graminicola]|nr:hypothetical protein CGRA01v4_05965 [Colletotrichum graminicola]
MQVERRSCHCDLGVGYAETVPYQTWWYGASTSFQGSHDGQVTRRPIMRPRPGGLGLGL